MYSQNWPFKVLSTTQIALRSRVCASEKFLSFGREKEMFCKSSCYSLDNVFSGSQSDTFMHCLDQYFNDQNLFFRFEIEIKGDGIYCVLKRLEMTYQ